MRGHADPAEQRSLDEPLPRASERLSHGEPTWFVDGTHRFLTLHKG
jgi:hypothetical protein